MLASCQSSSDSDSSADTSSDTDTANTASVINDVTIDDFIALMSNPTALLLDVRTAAEVTQGSIEGATNLDVNSSTFKEEVAKLDKNMTYLVYCKAGGRSTSACNIMKDMGFNSLYNLQGGYTAWEAAD